MKSFLREVISACEALGKQPYDDEKTRNLESIATRRVVELFESKKDVKRDVSDGSSDTTTKA